MPAKSDRIEVAPRFASVEDEPGVGIGTGQPGEGLEEFAYEPSTPCRYFGGCTRVNPDGERHWSMVPVAPRVASALRAHADDVTGSSSFRQPREDRVDALDLSGAGVRERGFQGDRDEAQVAHLGEHLMGEILFCVDRDDRHLEFYKLDGAQKSRGSAEHRWLHPHERHAIHRSWLSARSPRIGASVVRESEIGVEAVQFLKDASE